MKKLLSIILSITMIVFALPFVVTAAESDVVILYTNDVHCTVDDYAYLAAYKAELIANGHTVITVDAGDAIKNDDICSLNAGNAVVDIMNAVGYDYAVPGNYEFGYGMEDFLDLAETKANFDYMSSNFYYLPRVKPVFEPYYIEDVGDYQIAFVGITTPETITEDTAPIFKDENGNFIYGFPVFPGGMTNEILYETIQESVDEAKANGADIVVAVGHTGITETTDGWTTSDIIANTSGIDYFIDGHSHDIIESESYENKNNEEVILTTTGSEFDYFGAMTIYGDGSADFELIDPDTIELETMSTDAIDAYNTVYGLIDDYNNNFDAFGHEFVDSICKNCGVSCTHKDFNYDEICDICDKAVPMTVAELNVWDTVYIPEEDATVTVKFIPEASGEYAVVSDNGGNDDYIDPYVYIYNADGDEIAYNDDDTYENTYNFCCEFEAEAGETYYVELSCYDGNVEYDYVVRKNVKITHQPTVVEPYVELNDDTDATYQWYTVEYRTEEITGENADVVSYDWGTSSYDEEKGWIGVSYSENDYYGHDYFTIPLKAGDEVSVEIIGDYTDGVGLWDYAEENGVWVESTGETTYELTVDWDGDYSLYTYVNSGDVYIKAEVCGNRYTAIDDETSAALKNPVVGNEYCCKVTLDNGVVLESDLLEYGYAITHQPTKEEPCVELNDDTDATYQWYSAVGSTVEVTDENADIVSGYEGAVSSYDTEKGWSGAYVGNLEGTYTYNEYFAIALNAGDKITIEVTEGYIGYVEISGKTTSWQTCEIEDENICEFTVEYDDIYTVATYNLPNDEDIYVKAYVDGYEYTAIDGATNALYAATEDGLYACEVTFADGTTEMSDVYEGPHAHSYNTVVTDPTCTEDGYTTYTCGCGDTYVDDETDATGHADNDNDGYCDECEELLDPSVECDHNCHKGGILGFFWKIARFFNKLFGINKYCECGVAHY